MKKLLLCLLLFFCARQAIYSQDDYKASATQENDLVHTKLNISFDYGKSYAYGKAWLTLKPHFYPTSTVAIDAKGMVIQQVALANGVTISPLKYTYDNAVLTVNLGRTYTAGSMYVVYIQYTARPDELNMPTRKGLYFINPKGEDKSKPTQFWTHGETEGTSVWCPTIDKPNQKSTQEMYLTVPAAQVTLSNGVLVSSVKNSNGTRTDYWKMDQPNAPYLFFVAAGDYAVVKDKYKNKEVSYYVEKQYLPHAKKLFGATPEMMAYFSRITGIDYPWQKYSQVVVRDFLSGSMENTTATVHHESIMQDERELAEGNKWEGTIAHELFHHWFGNYVTVESWSNLTLSESFATYAEYLWAEHKYGRAKADEQYYNKMLGYLYGGNDQKDLVRFYYGNWEDLFDGVSYNKGACVLHMLRGYIGDSAFFKSMNRYLSAYKFRNAEAHEFRLIVEEVTGRDLNWFFNQWYFSPGHPRLDISYAYDDAAGAAKVTIKQLQDGKPFRLKIPVDVYSGADKKRYQIDVTQKEQSFFFPYIKKPDLINVDGDKTLLCIKDDHKSLDNFIHQFNVAASYVDKREAVNAFFGQPQDPRAQEYIGRALMDADRGIRFHALMVLQSQIGNSLPPQAEPVLANMVSNEPDAGIKAVAIRLLALTQNKAHAPAYSSLLGHSSYAVAGEALDALADVDPAAALDWSKKIRNTQLKGRLAEAVAGILMRSGADEDFDFYASGFDNLPMSEYKMQLLNAFAASIGKVDNTARFKKGIDIIVRFRDAIPGQFRQQSDAFINNVILKNIAERKANAAKVSGSADLTAQVQYVQEKIPPPDNSKH